jgi:hypothetical protein
VARLPGIQFRAPALASVIVAAAPAALTLIAQLLAVAIAIVLAGRRLGGRP